MRSTKIVKISKIVPHLLSTKPLLFFFSLIALQAAEFAIFVTKDLKQRSALGVVFAF